MENPLKKLFSLEVVSRLTHPETSAIGIDIGSSFLKIVQVKKKGGKAVLETYGELALGPYGGVALGQATNLPAEKLAPALLDLMTEAKVTTKNAALSIPFSASLVSLIELPAASERELDSIVPVEARKYIPVPISEVSLDWWLIPRPESEGTAKQSKLSVLVAAIHNDTISKYQSLIKDAGLESAFFEIEMFSTIRSTFGRDMSLVMVLDMGAGSTKLSIVESGVVHSSHLVDRGSQDITVALSKSLGIPIAEAEKLKREYGLPGKPDDKNVREIISLSTDYIFSEVNRVLLNYEKKYNKTISKVILTGGGVLLKGFADAARENLQAEVVYGDPFSKLEAPAFLSDLLREAGPEFAVAIGLALRKLSDTA